MGAFVAGVVISAMCTPPVMATTQDQNAELFPGRAPLVEEAGLEIDPYASEANLFNVVGDRLTFEQEIFFRNLRSALRRSPGTSPKDPDKWSCWISQGSGANSPNYLLCGRGSGMVVSSEFVVGPYWHYDVMRINPIPLSERQLERIFGLLAGPESLDEEFVSLAMLGKRTPRDIPLDDELASFAEAYKVVTSLQANGGSEQSQIRAIESRGLTLDRYNRIAELTETYQSIENDIAARIK